MTRIEYVGHATVLIEIDGVRLLTDPLLRGRLMHLRRAGQSTVVTPEQVDAVLLSHLHFDHLDIPSLRQLGSDVRIVAPRGAGRLLAKKGFGNAVEVASGDELTIGDVRITAVPAAHPATRLPFGTRADPVGYVLTGSRTVYFAGDTDLFPEMAELGPVDLALLPVWGWGPSLGQGHLNPRSAADAAQLIRPSIAIPIHWGTYFPAHAGLRTLPAFLDFPATQFRANVAERAPDVEVRVLRPGDETTL